MPKERITAAWRRTAEQADAERIQGKQALSDALAEQRKRSEAAWDAATAKMRVAWCRVETRTVASPQRSTNLNVATAELRP